MFNALLLAAGLSSRLGLPKQVLKIGGTSLLEKSLQVLSLDSIREIVVVEGPIPLVIPSSYQRVKIISNQRFFTGMGSSISKGVKGFWDLSLPLLIHLVDKPLLKEETLLLLMENYQKKKPLILAPIFQGIRGHPVFFHQTLYPSLRKLKREGGRMVLQEIGEKEILEIQVKDRGVIYDVDTWEDYLGILGGLSY